MTLIQLGRASGCIFSGLLAERYGRRTAIFFVIIPFVCSAVMFFIGSTRFMVVVGGGLMGICVGLMEIPTLVYISEISEPSIRGVLLAIAILSMSLGNFVDNLIKNMEREHALAILTGFPVLTVFASYFVSTVTKN